MLHTRFSITLAALIASAAAAPALDTFGPGFGLDEVRILSAQTSFSAHDTLAGGDRVVFDGSLVWREQDDGTVLHLLGAMPAPVFASFVEVDPTEAFAVIGESSTGQLYRVPLAGTGPVPLAVLAFNYDLAFEAGGTALVSAFSAACGCENEIHRVDLATGATTRIAVVPGPSGPLALSPSGDLCYATQSFTFPTPPGAIDVVRWSAAEISAGPFPLSLAQATVLTSGLDGCASLAFDAEFGHLFAAESVFGGVSHVLEIDRAGVRVGIAASSLDTLGKLEVSDAAGSGVLAAFQPAGRRLLYRTTDYNQGTSQIVKISPRRPVLSAQQNPNGTMTVAIAGATPGTSCFVVSSSAAIWSPTETAYDLATYLFWTGMPFANIRRAGIQFGTDAGGAGSFTFANPPVIQGTRVIQVLVRDASGTFRGSSTTVTN